MADAAPDSLYDHLLPDPMIRAIVRKRLREEHAELPSSVADLCAPAAVESLLRLLEERSREARASFRAAFSAEVATARVACLATGLLGFALVSHDYQDDPVYPRDWLAPDASSDPNEVIGSMFALLANHSLGILLLAEAGLDFSARPLMRTAVELATLICVLAADRQELLRFSHSGSSTSWLTTWNREFSPRKLNMKFKEVQRRLGIEDVWLDEFVAWRQEAYTYYAQTTHTAPLIALLGAYAIPTDDPDGLEYSLFGHASVGGANLLHDLCLHTGSSLGFFQRIITQLHGRHYARDNPFFGAAYAFSQALGDCLPTLQHRRDVRDTDTHDT